MEAVCASEGTSARGCRWQGAGESERERERMGSRGRWAPGVLGGEGVQRREREYQQRRGRARKCCARACIGLSVRGVEGRMSKEGLEVVIGERGERLAAALSRRCGHVEWGSGQCSRCARGRGRCG